MRARCLVNVLIGEELSMRNHAFAWIFETVLRKYNLCITIIKPFKSLAGSIFGG